MVILTTADTIEELKRKMNGNASKLQEWTTENRLTLNETKTNYIVFNAPRDIQFQIKYGNTTLKRVTQTKYLGVIIDENLNWKPHIKKMTSNIATIAGIFKRIGKYIPTAHKRQLYYAMFNSKITRTDSMVCSL